MTDDAKHDRARRARDLFLFDSNNCAQSILWAFADLDEDTEAAVLPLAWALGGGLAGQGHVCGTLLGAVMVLGAKLHYEHNLPAGEAQAVIAEFIREFEGSNGSLQCREIVGELHEEGFEQICRPMLYDTCQMLEESLARMPEEGKEHE